MGQSEGPQGGAMLRLILIRHAKSSWSEPRSTDKLRPLKKRGIKDAPRMGRYIRESGLNWDVLYCSPALRAKSTADLLGKELSKKQAGYTIKPELYAFDHHEVLAFLKTRSTKHQTIALVGHNPAFTDLTNLLTGAGLKNIPTCGVVEMQLDVKKWSNLKRDCGQLILFQAPKKLAAEEGEATSEAD